MGPLPGSLLRLVPHQSSGPVWTCCTGSLEQVGAWPICWELNTWSQVLRSEEVRTKGWSLEGPVGYDQMLAYADTDGMSDEHCPSI